MKRILAIALLSIILIASAPRDSIPSAVYYGLDANGRAGAVVYAQVGGVVVASAPVINSAYFISIPMDAIAEGTPVVFWTKQPLCVGGSSVLYAGTATELDLYFPVCTKPRR